MTTPKARPPKDDFKAKYDPKTEETASVKERHYKFADVNRTDFTNELASVEDHQREARLREARTSNPNSIITDDPEAERENIIAAAKEHSRKISDPPPETTARPGYELILERVNSLSGIGKDNRVISVPLLIQIEKILTELIGGECDHSQGICFCQEIDVRDKVGKILYRER